MERILLRQCRRDSESRGNLRVCLNCKMLQTQVVRCLLFLTVLALSLAEVKAQTWKQEKIQGPRAERVLGNISLEHVVSWPCDIVLTINTSTDTLWKEL